MPRVFFGNFDFEHELAHVAAASAGPAGGDSLIAHQRAWACRKSELFWAWLPVAQPDDFLIAPGRVDLSDFKGLVELGLEMPRLVHEPRDLELLRGAELVPWGWTVGVVAFGSSHALKCSAPPLEVVQQVNSREFRFALENQLNVGLAGAEISNSTGELQAIIEHHGSVRRGWLLKANFGMSGRETLRGRGTILDDQTRNWAQKRLAISGPIVFEPIVERIAEAGIQLEVPQRGPPQVVGITPLLVDRSGVYRGSRFECPAGELEAWQPAVNIGMHVALTLQRIGYFGPLGIDAMRYRDDTGEIRLRPLQDLNARYTMGRLALGFARILPSKWCGSWLHFHRRHLAGRDVDSWFDSLRRSLPAGTNTALTAPRKIGAQPVEHHALLILAPSPELRRHAEAALFDSLAISIDAGRAECQSAKE